MINSPLCTGGVVGVRGDFVFVQFFFLLFFFKL